MSENTVPVSVHEGIVSLSYRNADMLNVQS